MVAPIGMVSYVYWEILYSISIYQLPCMARSGEGSQLEWAMSRANLVSQAVAWPVNWWPTGITTSWELGKESDSCFSQKISTSLKKILQILSKVTHLGNLGQKRGGMRGVCSESASSKRESKMDHIDNMECKASMKAMVSTKCAVSSTCTDSMERVYEE